MFQICMRYPTPVTTKYLLAIPIFPYSPTVKLKTGTLVFLNTWIEKIPLKGRWLRLHPGDYFLIFLIRIEVHFM